MYFRFDDGVLETVFPTNHAYNYGWEYVFKFKNWRVCYEMTDHCKQLLGNGAWRGKNNHSMDDLNAKWLDSIGSKVYWRSESDMRLCCMQYLLTL